jgi:hypothetical protein
MLSALKRCASGFTIACAAASILALAPGCSLDRFRGEGFKDKPKDWGGPMRPEAESKDHAGFSAKAQEIEDHLGS